MKKKDLSGKWSYRTDENDVGLSEKWYLEDFSKEFLFALPGSTCQNGIGKKQDFYETYTREAVRAPREKYEYIAPLWLQKNFELAPEEIENDDVLLFLERVNISSMLFLDGEQVGREITGLSTPHVYDLSSKMTHTEAGKHTLTLRIDNRNLLNFGDMASGYSIDTQGIWNGIIGEIGFRFVPKVRIDDVQVHEDPKHPGSLEIRVITKSEQHRPMEVLPGTLSVSVTTPDGRTLISKKENIELFTKRARVKIAYDLTEAGETKMRRWNEFDPAMYTVSVSLLANGSICDTKEISFGLRNVHVENKKLMLDDRILSLRGTINCAQYPLTGYPPTDVETWTGHFSAIRSFGFNHVRFHAWCPPEAAFTAADRLGLYLLVEMPMWMNKDVVPVEVGDDPIHETFYFREAREIRRNYGNHPSFMMFSNGNENLGDFALLEDITEMLKATDRRCLYTLTSNFDHPVSDAEDYLSAFEMGHMPSRIQFLHDKVAEGTTINYDNVVENIPVPVISFEVGQYCVYPDVDCAALYTGAMLPVNFDIIKKMMIEKGVYDKLDDYIKASGDMAGRLYKEDIEAVLRTDGFGGIELLSATDYTGQSTATVGIMDVFFRDKKAVDKDFWCGFCNEVVPLFESKRIFSNTETLRGRISLYDHGEKPIREPVYGIEILATYGSSSVNSEKPVYSCMLPSKGEKYTDFALGLGSFTEPAMLTVKISVSSDTKIYTNSWNIFVYPSENASKKMSDAFPVICLTDYAASVGREIIKTNFIPVFWSPVHFPSKASYGAMIDKDDPSLSGFPTRKYPDYQWKMLFEHGTGIDISGLPVKPVIEMVPNYVDNTRISPLFWAEKDGGRVLVCGFDTEENNITVKALKNSLGL